MLKYILSVLFADGQIWNQDPLDVSLIDPKKSQYYDLLQIKKTIARAHLSVPNDLGFKGSTLEVDLLTGNFYINGVEFQIDQNPLPPMQRELVFFRQHQHDTNITYSKKTGKTLKIKEEAHRIKYFLGWKINFNGKEYQQIVGID